jgi:hypothetical protein
MGGSGEILTCQGCEKCRRISWVKVVNVNQYLILQRTDIHTHTHTKKKSQLGQSLRSPRINLLEIWKVLLIPCFTLKLVDTFPITSLYYFSAPLRAYLNKVHMIDLDIFWCCGTV